MARPQRCRVICSEPEFTKFEPNEIKNSECVKLTFDEFEVIRIVDYEKKNHEYCASMMHVSRTTVTEIYERARFKISDCIINGKQLIITGGNYKVCEGNNSSCCNKSCYKKVNGNIYYKGEIKNMKIAVTYENGNVFQHFGHTENFKIFEVREGKIIKSEVVNSNGVGHGALALLLKEYNVNVLICGGIGGGAQRALSDVNIEVYGGVSGNANQVVEAFINGKLDFNPHVECEHHSHDENHSCGHNGCH